MSGMPQTYMRPALLALALLPAALLSSPAAEAAPFELPSIDRIVNYNPKLPLQVLTADGVEIAQFGAERREFVPLSRIPKQLQDAVLAVEDARFREHSGVDPKGMARAALALITGGRRQGASTITQQLVRTMLLTREFSAERKAKEIMLALKVEQAISKDRILEVYLNEIFLGQRAYGFAAAAQISSANGWTSSHWLNARCLQACRRTLTTRTRWPIWNVPCSASAWCWSA